MFRDRIAHLAADRVSGASEILARTIDILREALAADADVLSIARALVRAQPSMAPVWNAALAALAARDDARCFETFARRVAGAPSALRRVTRELFGINDVFKARGASLHVITVSYSGSVLSVLESLAAVRPLEVSCSEGRPAMEGRALAARLAAAGITVTCTTDAAIAQALTSGDAVLVGADAVTAGWFLNKAGTRMLVAAASAERVPVYVVASRDKFASAAVASRLTIREGAASEVWTDPPPGVRVRNVYFEPTRLEEVTGIITEDGLLDASMAREICVALDSEAPEHLVAVLDDAPGSVR